VSELIIDGKRAGNRYDIVVIAEGAKPTGRGFFVRANRFDDAGRESLGGVGEYLSAAVYDNTGLESRSVVLGNVQRGGNPCAYDRRMGRYYGIAAANLIFRKEFGKMVGYMNNSFTAIPLEEIFGRIKLVDIKNMYDTDRYNGLRNI